MEILKPCKYRSSTNNPKRVSCTSTNLIHSGTVSTEVCLICPYCTNERNDFFTMTNKLFSLNKPYYVQIPCCGKGK